MSLPTRTLCYIGSKRKLGPALRDLIVQRWPDTGEYTLADAFFGCGAFTLAVGSAFKAVITNDQMLFSDLIAHAISTPPLEHPADLAPLSGYVTEVYSPEGAAGRKYFSPENAHAIDSVRCWLQGQPESPARRSAAGRLLCSLDRVANTTAVYGAYLKAYSRRARTALPVVDVFDASLEGKVSVRREDAVDFCLGVPEACVLYLDPPYTKASYGGNYFVLNVIGDLNADAQLKGVTGRPAPMPASAWCNAAGARRELLRITKDTPARRIVMSYSTDGVMSHADVLKTFRSTGWSVDVHRIGSKRYSSHAADDEARKDLFELVFLAERISPETQTAGAC